jgi:hypothetical protein
LPRSDVPRKFRPTRAQPRPRHLPQALRSSYTRHRHTLLSLLPIGAVLAMFTASSFMLPGQTQPVFAGRTPEE